MDCSLRICIKLTIAGKNSLDILPFKLALHLKQYNADSLRRLSLKIIIVFYNMISEKFCCFG